jgi:hypothetical protein
MSRPRDYQILVPDGWFRISLDGAARYKAITTLVNRQFRGLDNVPQLKLDTRKALRHVADAAYANGGIEMYVALQTATGFPLPASLIVSLTPPHEDPAAAVTPDRLAGSLAGQGGEVTLVDLRAGQAVRVRHPDTGSSGQPGLEYRLDMHVPVPDSSSYLILSFSTPMNPLADPMTDLFDTIASTLRWVR